LEYNYTSEEEEDDQESDDSEESALDDKPSFKSNKESDKPKV
jgi:hypothetical protein